MHVRTHARHATRARTSASARPRLCLCFSARTSRGPLAHALTSPHQTFITIGSYLLVRLRKKLTIGIAEQCEACSDTYAAAGDYTSHTSTHRIDDIFIATAARYALVSHAAPAFSSALELRVAVNCARAS
eukprot:6140932-Pleurochrysis_carterae.AAC.1